MNELLSHLVNFSMANLSPAEISPSLESRDASVSEILELLNTVLLDTVGSLCFHGEVSECKMAPSGHLYLSISDGQSSVRATIWANLARQLKFQVKPGIQLLCVGRPSIYPKNGSFQMILSRVDLYGEGALQKRFLELKAKLVREGIFNESRKRSLPSFPRAIGVVTSKSGAVIHDILIKVRERLPSLDVYLYDARVQGPGSAEEIVLGIQHLNSLEEIDVIIVARGGGSLEDLWSFNEEIVARAIFASRLPIVSGVGHETDISLADLAADKRAPTPTAAAEFVTPRRIDLLERIARAQQRLDDLDRWFMPRFQALDDLSERLARSSKHLLDRLRQNVSLAEAKLKRLEPHQLLSMRRHKLDAMVLRLSAAAQQKVLRQQHRLHILSEKLNTLNPTKVLERGFVIVQKNGKLVRKSTELAIDDSVQIRFAEGRVESTVTAIDGRKM
jgi:exodeoxyribonuclease VII large subunit